MNKKELEKIFKILEFSQKINFDTLVLKSGVCRGEVFDFMLYLLKQKVLTDCGEGFFEINQGAPLINCKIAQGLEVPKPVVRDAPELQKPKDVSNSNTADLSEKSSSIGGLSALIKKAKDSKPVNEQALEKDQGEGITICNQNGQTFSLQVSLENTPLQIVKNMVPFKELKVFFVDVYAAFKFLDSDSNLDLINSAFTLLTKEGDQRLDWEKTLKSQITTQDNDQNLTFKISMQTKK